MYVPPLNTLMLYKNKAVISRYSQDFPNATMQAEEAFTELMKFVWLCFKHKLDKYHFPHNELLNFNCVIHAEMVDIDNMWHTFLLFTREYHKFCNEYLDGHFFHHDPITNTNDSLQDENYEQELTLYLTYIYDSLGEDTLIKWFGQHL